MNQIADDDDCDPLLDQILCILMCHLTSSPLITPSTTTITFLLILIYLCSGMCSGSPGNIGAGGGGDGTSSDHHSSTFTSSQHLHLHHNGKGCAFNNYSINNNLRTINKGYPNASAHTGINNYNSGRQGEIIVANPSNQGLTSDNNINKATSTWNYDLPLSTLTKQSTKPNTVTSQHQQLSVRLKKDLTYISYDTRSHQQIYYSQLSSPSSSTSSSFSTSVPSPSPSVSSSSSFSSFSSLPLQLTTNTTAVASASASTTTPTTASNKTKPISRTSLNSSSSQHLTLSSVDNHRHYLPPPRPSYLSSSSLSISASPSASSPTHTASGNPKSPSSPSSSRTSSSYHQESLTSLNQLRMFEEKAIPKNITAQVGLPVYLHCIVEPIGDKMVSWIRLRDFHLLTVGLFTYSSDSRFVIRHGTLQPNDWALQIKHVTPKDEGLYECQVNTDPPRSQYFYLKVLVPYTRIAGSGNDIIVSAGSTINLTCIISQSPNPPSYVFWYHNDRMINYDLKNEGTGQVTLTKDPVQSDTLISRLTLRNARYNSSGNYTCAPFNIEPSSIYLHVLQGAKQLSHNWPQNDEGSSTEFTSSNRGGSTTTNYNKLLTHFFPFKSTSSSSPTSFMNLTPLLTTIFKFFILLLAAILNNQLMYSCIT